jgi:hypothetical protein
MRRILLNPFQCIRRRRPSVALRQGRTEGHGQPPRLPQGEQPFHQSRNHRCRPLQQAVAEKAKQVFDGRVDILFNNAGTQNEVESILDLSDDQWEYVFKTNIHAIFYLTKALIVRTGDVLWFLGQLR